jgi:hypothetical protein
MPFVLVSELFPRINCTPSRMKKKAHTRIKKSVLSIGTPMIPAKTKRLAKPAPATIQRMAAASMRAGKGGR